MKSIVCYRYISMYIEARMCYDYKSFIMTREAKKILKNLIELDPENEINFCFDNTRKGEPGHPIHLFSLAPQN